MEKERADSWCKIETKNNNAIARKTVDYSTFDAGTTISTRYHEDFLSNLSKEIIEGTQLKINIVINNIKFDSVIKKANSKNRKSTIIQIIFRKNIKEYLSKELFISYDYIMKHKDQNSKAQVKLPDEYKEYMDFYKGQEKDTFVVKLVKKDNERVVNDEDIDDNNIEDIEEDLEESEIIRSIEVDSIINYIHNYITRQGYTYEKLLVKNLYISLKTKPFVILSGVSGTGKSKILELFAKALGATAENKRFNLIPVKPDWSDSTDLLGFRNIEGKFTPGAITKVCYRAMMNPQLPYFICLDEMNLARVEYYFSDILSLMETRRLNENREIITNTLLGEEQIGRDSASVSTYGDVYIPENLYIIGTVNMDETTFPFSKKVLDRANTIEFNKVNLKYDFDALAEEELESRKYHNDFLKAQYLKLSDCREHRELAEKVIEELVRINAVLEKYNFHFAYRVRDEIVFYMLYAVENKVMDFETSLDHSIVQKILPKISGSGNEVLEALIELFNLLNGTSHKSNGYIEEEDMEKMQKECSSSTYKQSSEKLLYMIRRYVRDGFTTFWQ